MATPPTSSPPPATAATTRTFAASEVKNLVLSTMSLSPVQDNKPFSASSGEYCCFLFGQVITPSTREVVPRNCVIGERIHSGRRVVDDRAG